MAWIKIMYGNTIVAPISTFVCDTVGDIDNLPTNVVFGSKAEVIAEQLIYKLNSSGTWTLFSGVITPPAE